MAYGSETVCQSDETLEQNIADFLTNAEVKDGVNISFDDIVGLQESKEKMKELIILPIEFPLLFKGKQTIERILMYGAPGVGKTMLLQAMIAEIVKYDALCFRLSVYDLLSRLNPSPTRCLDALFARAREQTRSLIIIQDVDVLGQEGDAKIDGLKESLSCHEHQVVTKDKDTGFQQFVVYVTNKPWKLSKRVMRRFCSKRIYVPLPNDTECLDILKQNLKSVQNDLTEANFSSVGDLMKRFTGSDIVVVARDASMHPIRRVQHATHFKKVSGSPDHNPGTHTDAHDPGTCTDDHDPGSHTYDLLTPCGPDDVGAMEMTWMDIPSTKLYPQPVCLDNIRQSLSDMKPSISEEEQQQFETLEDTLYS